MLAPSSAAVARRDYLGRVQELAAFMAERHAVYMRKAWLEEQLFRQDEGLQPPGMGMKMHAAWLGAPGTEGNNTEGPERWQLAYLTDDPILQRYRFCNVYRELDRVTVWIRENIREPFADHEHLWFMLAVARHINWPDTLDGLIKSTRGTWPDKPGFKPEYMTAHLEARAALGQKVYTGAYMIRAEQYDRPWRHWSKQRYSAEIVLGKLWEDRAAWSSHFRAGQSTLQEVWSWFQDSHYTGWGPFMAQQVVADLRWTRYLRKAHDVGNWTAVGPGSARGLNRLHGRPVAAAVRQEQGLEEMREVRQLFLEEVPLAPWLDVPELSDIQNCLCEFDKYERVRLGEGRPRSLYIPGRGS